MKTEIISRKQPEGKRSIFIIEDNKDIGFILSYFLREEGFKVDLFPTAAEFGRAFLRDIPDLFLVDVMLPDGNGIELCEQIKKDNRSSELPVLIMSAQENRSEADNCDAEEFIPKPFDLDFLLKRIRTYLAAA